MSWGHTRTQTHTHRHVSQRTRPASTAIIRNLAVTSTSTGSTTFLAGERTLALVVALGRRCNLPLVLPATSLSTFVAAAPALFLRELFLLCPTRTLALLLPRTHPSALQPPATPIFDGVRRGSGLVTALAAALRHGLGNFHKLASLVVENLAWRFHLHTPPARLWVGSSPSPQPPKTRARMANALGIAPRVARRLQNLVGFQALCGSVFYRTAIQFLQTRLGGAFALQLLLCLLLACVHTSINMYTQHNLL